MLSVPGKRRQLYLSCGLFRQSNSGHSAPMEETTAQRRSPNDSHAGRVRSRNPCDEGETAGCTLAPMAIREFVLDTYVHLAPMKMLEDLSGSNAVRTPLSHMHSVAGLVAHMDFWQRWFLQRCAGVAVPMATRAADGWPDVTAEGWPALLARFEHGLRTVADLGDDVLALDQPCSRPSSFLRWRVTRDAMPSYTSRSTTRITSARSSRRASSSGCGRRGPAAGPGERAGQVVHDRARQGQAEPGRRSRHCGIAAFQHLRL